MKLKNTFAQAALVALIGTVSLTPAMAASATHSFSGSRVAVESGKSFKDVSKSIEKLVAKSGMMVMAEVDQGKMLSMAGLKLNAKLFLIGNPNVGKQIFEQDRGAGLYVPLRIFVYEDKDGKTYVSYDRPSALMGQFDNKKVAMVGKMLDEKIEGLAAMAAK